MTELGEHVASVASEWLVPLFEPSRPVVAIGLPLLVGLTLGYVVVRRLLVRHRLMMDPVEVVGDGPRVNAGQMQEALKQSIDRIQLAHGRRDIGVAGESEELSRLTPASEDLGDRLAPVLLEATGFVGSGIALWLVERIWPILRFQSQLSDEEGRPSLHASVRRRGRTIATCFSQSAESPPLAPPQAVAADLAEQALCKLVVDLRARVGVTTRKWRAFQHLSRALVLLDEERRDSLPERNPHRHLLIERALHEAIAADPDYASAHYNLGLLYYEEHRGQERNREARDCFQKALEAAGRQAAENPTRRSRVVLQRLQGMALVGIARSYCQDVHRWGETENVPVQHARQAAHRAQELLGDTPEALYALAFAHHCTETLPDIRVGRQYYERILKLHRRPYPVVHNNLSFICYCGGILIERTGGPSEARRWWRDGLRHAARARSEGHSSPRITRFAWANTGSLHRLLGEHEPGLVACRNALGWVPEEGLDHRDPYANALNEYATLYLDRYLARGRRAKDHDLERGLRFHQQALRWGDSPSHRGKLCEYVADALARLDPSLRSVLEGLVRPAEPEDIPRWIARLQVSLQTRDPREAGHGRRLAG